MVLFQVEKRSVRMCPLRTIFIFPIIFVGTSESPDRDCCEPLYPFISTKSPNPVNNNNSSKLTLIWPLAGYYKGCSFLISVSFQFLVKYWEKFTPQKVHWFGILDPARYLVQSVTLPNTFNLQWDLYFRNQHQKWSWFMGIRPLKSKENFRTHFRLFHFFCNFFFFPDQDLSSRSSAVRFKPLKMTGII